MTFEPWPEARPMRMGWSALVAALLLLVIAITAPQQLGVVVYKLSLVCLLATVGYRIDRELYPYARPHDHWYDGHHAVGVGLMVRRAVIVAACIVGGGLGL